MFLQSPINYVLVRPTAGLMFPAVDYLRTYLTRALSEHQNSLETLPTYVVLDCGHISEMDFTGAQVSRANNQLETINY